MARQFFSKQRTRIGAGIAVLGIALFSAAQAEVSLGSLESPANAPIVARGASMRVADNSKVMMHMDHGAPEGAAAGETFKAGDIAVTSAWTRATPGGAKIAGGYLRITNEGKTADRLVSVSSALAGHSEIHEMSMANGVMKMREITGGLTIKPGETVALKPGGFHMMFMDIKQPLKQGDTLKATLTFEKAGPLDVAFKVGAIGAKGPDTSSKP